MIKIKNLNAAINRAMNALRSKPVKANHAAREALRVTLRNLNEARLLLNQGDDCGAYWFASCAYESLTTARRAMAA